MADCYSSCPAQHGPAAGDDLAAGRVASSIPRTDTQSPWLYPSPQQLHAAILRKGRPAPHDIGPILLMHNVVNEQCWQSVLSWERLHGSANVSLLRFRGRPDDLSPKAWLASVLCGYKPPFDRHDWTVCRQDDGGRLVRYVIDFYEGKPVDGKPVSLYLDVRPALDSPSALIDRLKAFVFGL